MRKHLTTVLLILVAVAILAVAFFVAGGSEFVGTDSAATEAVEASHPGYQPWFESFWAPESSEIESGLFALQAAFGAGVVGFVLGMLRERRKHGAGTS